MDKISGVYKITNKITGDFYIGSSTNIKKRWTYHRSLSVWIKHQPNSRLYKDMQEYGLDSFTFEIIEQTYSLKEREQYWIEQLKPSYNSIRADCPDIDIYKETHRRRCKAWYEAHKDEHLAKSKARHHTHRDNELARAKAYYSRLCIYKGETLTLGALRSRFSRQGIPHPTLEAKEYLISNHCKPSTSSQ